MGAHADADDRDLGHVGVMGDVAIVDRRRRGPRWRPARAPVRRARTVKVRSVCLAVLRDVLDDHVHIDAASASGPKMALAMPGWSGTLCSVILASSRL